MTELMLRSQKVFEILADLARSLPFWLALGVLFAPTVIALFTRRWVTIFSTALLGAASLAALAAGNDAGSGVPVAIVAFVASWISMAHGLRERRLGQSLSGLEARVGHIDKQLTTFLHALERRSDLIDETAEEARRSFEDAHKQLLKAFPVFPQSPGSSAAAGDAKGSTAPGATSASTQFTLPTIKR